MKLSNKIINNTFFLQNSDVTTKENKINTGTSTPQTQVLHEKQHNVSKNTSDNVKDNVRDKEIKIKEVDTSFSSVQNPVSKAVIPDDVKKTLSERYSAESLDKSLSEQETTVSIWDFAGQHLHEYKE
jgi:hypothetical protein